MPSPFVFAGDRTAPLPISTYAGAIQRALELRRSNPTVMSYRTIAFVMAEFHGVHYSWQWWRMELLGAGAEPDPGRRGNVRNLPNISRACERSEVPSA